MHQFKVKYHHTHQARFVQKNSAHYLERSMSQGDFDPLPVALMLPVVLMSTLAFINYQ